MPDRAIIPLMPAVALGFTAGLIASVLQLTSGPTFILALCSAIVVAIAGVSSVFGCKGDTGEKAIVGVLRAACAVALMGCLFMFMLGFLREGSILQAIIWLPLAGVFGLLMARLTVRNRKPVEQHDEDADEQPDADTGKARSELRDDADCRERIYRESDGFSQNGNGPREKTTA